MREEIDSRYAVQRERLRAAGQDHLLRFWGELAEEQRMELLAELESLDLELCARLARELVVNKPGASLPARLEPPEVFPAEPGEKQAGMYSEARRTGEDAIRAGRVAAFTVAGGQGTRLGFDGPKGAFRVSPLRRASLFQLFAEFLVGTGRRYGRRPPWYIMTSPGNHAATVEFFAAHGYFGLDRAEVMFFPQGRMPAFDFEGRIMLEERHRIALSPDGHGGSLTALASSGALADMRARGVEYISYFQVDNPLVRAIDPLFIGLHALQGSELSSKAVPKADDLERVGNFCLADGRLCVIEYSDLPESVARARNADGSRRIDAGSIAIHVFDRAFVERLTADGRCRLPWHRAEKKVPTVDAAGRTVAPREPNGVKVEMFVFDAIPLARRPLVMYTSRAEEFSPVKNAMGVDSVATAQRDMLRRAAAWVEACGRRVPRDGSGEPRVRIEISPAYALDASELRERLAGDAREFVGDVVLE